MRTRFIEVTNGFNYGKFMVGRFDTEEWSRRSGLFEVAHQVTDEVLGEGTYDEIHAQNPNPSMRPLLAQVGWTPDVLVVWDLQTGEGALFRPGGSARADLDKHRVWVCPMFLPFLSWLYEQDVTDLDALPVLVTLTETVAPSSLFGYRRPGPVEDEEEPEPEPEEYDPGPEVDDEGGMSEYRHWGIDDVGERD